MHFKTVGKDTENNLFRPILVKLLFFVNRFVLDQYLIFLALMIYSSEPGTAWAPDLLPSVIELIQYQTYPVRYYLPVQMFCLIPIVFYDVFQRRVGLSIAIYMTCAQKSKHAGHLVFSKP